MKIPIAWIVFALVSVSAFGITRPDASFVKNKNYLDCRELGIAPNTGTDVSSLIKSAIETASGTPIFFPKGHYQISSVCLTNGFSIFGESGTVFDCLGSSTPDAAGFWINSTGNIDGVTIDGVKFDGHRSGDLGTASDSVRYCGVRIYINPGHTLKNVRVVDSEFYNIKTDALRIIYVPTSTATANIVDGVWVERCRFWADSGAETNSDYFMNDGLRIQNAYNTTAWQGYYFAKNIHVTSCSSKFMRTLADIKRGCEGVTITDCFGENMFDCFHSVDQSRSVRISGNIGVHYDGFPNSLAGQYPNNCFEITGDDLLIENNIIRGNGVLRNGILVTDYGYPEELPASLGHRPRNVIIRNNLVSGMDSLGSGIKVVNGDNVHVYGNTIASSLIGISMDSGTSRVDLSGNLLYAGNNSVYDNRYFSVNRDHINGTGTIYINNYNEYGKPILGVANTIYGYASNSGALWTAITPSYVEKNTNPTFVASGTSVVDWGKDASGTLSIESSTASDPATIVSFARITDSETGSTDGLFYEKYLPVSQNAQVFMVFDAKVNDGPLAFCVQVLKYDSGKSFGEATFYGKTVANNDWKTYFLRYDHGVSTYPYVRLKLIPGTTYNNPTATGSMDITNVSISYDALGVAPGRNPVE